MEETTGRQSLLPRWFEELCERIASGNADNAPDNGPPITHVNLNLRRLSYPMTDALVHALSQTSRIQAINLTWSLVHMDTCSDQNLMALADVLRYHPSLEVVHLSYNRLTKAGPLGLALSTNTTLRELHLDHNRLTPESAIALAHGLSQNAHHTKLAVLCLNSNSIADTGGEAIASILEVNTSITTLQLANNDLGFKTIRQLWKSIQRNVTMVELGLDQNPHLPQNDKWQVLHLVGANRAGRYLIRQQEGHTTGPPPPLGLWPWVLARLELDLMFFFLREIPSIMTMGEAMYCNQ